jgi:hypothetical protein
MEAVTGGGKAKTIEIDLGLFAVSMSFGKECYGYSASFGSGPNIEGGGCPK